MGEKGRQLTGREGRCWRFEGLGENKGVEKSLVFPIHCAGVSTGGTFTGLKKELNCAPRLWDLTSLNRGCTAHQLGGLEDAIDPHSLGVSHLEGEGYMANVLCPAAARPMAAAMMPPPLSLPHP